MQLKAEILLIKKHLNLDVVIYNNQASITVSHDNLEVN